MEIKGVITKIFEEQQISETFKKREFVLKYAENPEYPEYPKFEVIKDRCQLLDNFAEGEEVTAHFNLKGRKWTNPKGEDVYFNTLQVWKITSDVKPHDITPEVEQNQAIASGNDYDTDNPPF